MVDDIFARGFANFVARTSGPLNLRFLIQPAVAVFLAIRAGRRDALVARPPFFWSLLTDADARKDRLREAGKDLGSVIILGLTLDFIYQIIVTRGVFVLELLFTVTLLAVVPYLLIRGPANRIARAWSKKRDETHKERHVGPRSI